MLTSQKRCDNICHKFEGGRNMYEERRDKFSIKDILIQVLFVAIFIFLLMWLFPMKKDVKNALKNLNIENPNLQPLYDQIFNNNVQTIYL